MITIKIDNKLYQELDKIRDKYKKKGLTINISQIIRNYLKEYIKRLKNEIK